MIHTRAALQIQDLCFRYPSYPGLEGRPLFDHLDLVVPTGSCVRLLGPPDSGKSTLARLVAGQVPRYTGGVSTGRVEAGGVEVATARPGDLLEAVGLVFQDPDEQILTTRCDTEVAFALESLGMDPEAMRDRVRPALAWAGLSGMAHRAPLTLSGGEKRRLLLACLHALRPRLYVLDECLDELDQRFRARLLRDLRSWGATVLLLAAKDIALEKGDVDATYRLESGRLTRAPRRAAGRRASEGRRTRGGSGAEILRAVDIEYRFAERDPFRLRVPRLSIQAGETVALTGPNGAGKTTLARLLCGLITPRSGSVVLDRGAGLTPASPELLRASVAYVFQNPDYQLFLPTVREELSYGMVESGTRTDAIEAGVSRAIRHFDLPPPDAPIALLSYGTRKRLAMAVYYLLARPLAILDEADAGLTREQFAAAVQAFRAAGTALLIISHDEAVWGGLCDRGIAMSEGAA